ncbi:DUF4595 domain-containing protein [Spirosoma luteum]|uniref:DUF4595 domain-containing protein n=1 Tax=Spirosoma luteum TaxID=431553 RepID=UPI00038126FE|nr:DUF4595 domain-containing protein [Spirosoma luteum]
MNTLFPKIALAVAIGSISCQTENLVNPDQPSAVAKQTINDIIPINLPKFTLVKDGPQTVCYYPDGRLKRVIYGLDVPGNTSERTDYTYDSHSVKATMTSENKVYSEETYVLDATGRCFQYRAYTYPNGSTTKIKYMYNYSYTYDSQGRLKTWADNANSLLYQYTYNADGDLSLVILQKGGTAQEEFTFAYKLPNAVTLLPDSYPLNAQLNFKWWGLLSDTYLAVFGTASSHLVKRVTRKNLLTNQVTQNTTFTYTLDANGYVTNRTSVNDLTGITLDTKAYEYEAADTLPTF